MKILIFTVKMYGAKSFLFASTLALLSCYVLQIAGAVITNPSEASALRAVRRNLIDPFNNLKTWSNGDPCTSNWTGIVCNSTSNDGYLHIQKIQLLKLNLSGSLAPELGLLPHLDILDFMWNKLNGSFPKEIGNIASLRLLLLSGNQLSGAIPEEIGFLHNLNRLQIDQNNISGPIPMSFANLKNAKHFHMNNNSISGKIPPELSGLPKLLHFLLDNNNLSGFLPSEFSKFPSLKILQLDNNNFTGSSIPAFYSNMSTLKKLSLRNCGLKGVIPDLSRMPQLSYIDLSSNQLTGIIPSNMLSVDITTIDLSNNFLSGLIPSSFSRLPKLQRLSLENNQLDGSVPSFTWKDMTFDGNNSLILNFQNNSITNISNTFNPPENVTTLLYGNPICENRNLPNMVRFCQYQIINQASESLKSSKISCLPCPTDLNYEHNPLSPIPCICSIPLGVEFRLKSPGISDFRPYIDYFERDLTSLLHLALYQLHIDSFIWETGPRLHMDLKIFPNNTSLFGVKEVLRIRDVIGGWAITLSDVFGPYELLDFTLGYYANELPHTSTSGISKGALVGILLGAIMVGSIISIVATLLILRRRSRHMVVSRRQSSISKSLLKVDGVKGFTYVEMAKATNNFSNSTQIGYGGYGKVYRGILVDGTEVAIKRAQSDSLQGSKEFSTEVELLSRVHHRNLVSLVGYCNEEDEQMLVYEFMPNGTLRDHLNAKFEEPLNFQMRLRIALETAKGILYLHTEAYPPIFHRDIKASNILLDSKFVAKVADFGLSRLAPVPDLEGMVPDYVSTVVKGTPGYLDPEYFLTQKLTDKSDVYSLGVVFLELSTGMKAISYGKNIVREVKYAFQTGNLFPIIDNEMGSYPSDSIGRFVSLALRCCQNETDSRPSMSEVVTELEVIWRTMPKADTSPLEYTDLDSNLAKSSVEISSTSYQFNSSDASSSQLNNTTSTIAPR